MKLTIEYKLMIVFGILAALVMLFILYIRTDLKEFEKNIEHSQTIQEEIMTAKNIQLHVLNIWQFITDASLTKDRQVIDEEARPNLIKAKESMDKFLTIGDEVEHSEEMNIMKQELNNMWSTGIKMFEAYEEDWEQGNAVMNEFDIKSDEIITNVGNLVAEENNEGKAAVDEMYRMVERSLKIVHYVIISCIALFLLIFAFLRSLSKSITKPLSRLVKAANQVADGDLSVEIEDVKTKNEVGILSNDFNRMLTALKKIITEVKEGSALLVSSTEELSASAVQIVEGARSQDVKSSHVAASSQELSATIVDVAQNASGAAESAKDANEVAVSGSSIVDKSIESINGIANTSRETSALISVLGDRSNEVGAIIQVIDDIASQTNLLALNAAIEAARAGEQGRGFAVVADEVRKLAEKTTNATKQISETINVIQSDTNTAIESMSGEMEAVEKGVAHATDAGVALKDILGKITEVNSMIELIATASEEQSTAADQISGDIESVASISKETSSSAEQVASSSQDIARLASNLNASISHFRLNNDSSKKSNSPQSVLSGDTGKAGAKVS